MKIKKHKDNTSRFGNYFLKLRKGTGEIYVPFGCADNLIIKRFHSTVGYINGCLFH